MPPRCPIGFPITTCSAQWNLPFHRVRASHSNRCVPFAFFPVMSTTLLELGILPNAALLLLVSRVIFLVVNLSYYHHLGRKPKKM